MLKPPTKCIFLAVYTWRKYFDYWTGGVLLLILRSLFGFGLGCVEDICRSPTLAHRFLVGGNEFHLFFGFIIIQKEPPCFKWWLTYRDMVFVCLLEDIFFEGLFKKPCG